MRKSIISAILISATCSVASAQTFHVEGQNSDTWYVSGNKDTDCKFHVKNTSDSNVSFKYRKISESIADNAWTFQFCDNSQCFPLLIDYSTALPIKPNEVIDFKITANPNWKVGISKVSYAIWNIKDSTKKDTLYWTFNCQWGLGANSAKGLATTKVYPNPASGNEVFVNTTTSKGMIEIMDMSGRVILTSAYNSEAGNVARLNISSLNSGSYLVAVLSENNEKTTARLLKQ